MHVYLYTRATKVCRFSIVGFQTNDHHHIYIITEIFIIYIIIFLNSYIIKKLNIFII